MLSVTARMWAKASIFPLSHSSLGKRGEAPPVGKADRSRRRACSRAMLQQPHGSTKCFHAAAFAIHADRDPASLEHAGKVVAGELATWQPWSVLKISGPPSD